MNEGFWINYDNDKVFPIYEHEKWLREGNNAKKLGIPKDVINAFGKYKPEKDRDKFLLFVMRESPVMRVRGHGSTWTFEFSTKKIDDVLFSIYKFCKDIAGDYTNLYIVNFANKDSIEILFKDFSEKIKEGDTESLLKVAKKFNFKNGTYNKCLP